MVSIDPDVDTDAIVDEASDTDGGDGGGGPETGDTDDVDDSTDPETGSTETRRLRRDAESDPMNEQTERVEVATDSRGGAGGGGRAGGVSSAQAEQIRREAERRQQQRQQEAQERPSDDGGGTQPDMRRLGGDPAGGGGQRAETPGEVDPEQIERDVTAQRVQEASTEGGGRADEVSSRDVERIERQERAPDVVSAPAGGFQATRGGTPRGETQLSADELSQVEETGRVEDEGADVSTPAGGFESVRGGTPARRGRRTVSTPAGGFSTVRGGLTQAETVEQDVSEAAGADVDLELGRDFTIDQDTGEVSLTEEGRRRASGDEFAERSEVIDLGGLPGVDEGTTLLDVKEAGQGILADLRENAERAAEDFQFTRGVSPLAAGATIGEPDTLPQTRVEAEVDQDSPAQEQLESFFVGSGMIATAPVSIGVAGIEATEFGIETGERYRSEGLGRLGTISRDEAGMAELDPGEGALGFAGEETAETGGQVVEGLEQQVRSPTGRAELAGSLAGSALIMGGAAAVSSRAGLASRVAIQPGEEALGYGGHFTTRAVAGGRAADRLFPDREPLIFSEEAAIRTARRAGRRGSAAARRVRAETTDFVLGEPETVVETEPSSFEGFQNIELREERPGVRSRLGDLRARLAEPERAQLQLTGGRRRGRGQLRGEAEQQQEPAPEPDDPRTIRAEDIAEPIPDPDQGPFFDPTTRELRREAGEAPENPIRSRARRAFERRRAATEPELSTEPESRTRPRAESAIMAEPLAFEGLGRDSLAIVDTRSVVGTDVIGEADLVSEADVVAETDTEASDIMVDSEFRPELRFETEAETRTELDLESELEAEFRGGGEAEVELDEDRRRRSGDRRREDDFEGWRELEERSLLNPFTGE